MNRTFKTIWSAARQQYIVSDEKHASRGKAAKATMAAVAVAAAFAAGSAFAAYVPAGMSGSSLSASNSNGYVETGVIGDKASWETDEYKANWGLTALKASSAYALGYHGQGVKVGMMDSGILKDHLELSGDRWHAVHASGEYSKDGVYYPQNQPGDQQEYHKGQGFDLDGYYNPEYNDNHGTGCAGVYAGNRNGTGMHGVAWGSEFYSANTGGNDNTNYGPFPDYGFFKTGYDALVNAGVKIINNSFGTNLKQVDENGNILDYYHSGPELTTVNDIEYEYFLFKKMYEEGPSFVDAAWEAVKGKDVIQVFTNGNNDRANPYHRALYPYFTPEAEKQWIAIAGLRQNSSTSDPDNYRLEANFNEAGYAKYWTMAGPGQNGYTSNISGGYGGYSGTSMAAPFVSGAFAVLASRYQDMSAVQVREVLLTTANHKNADGTNMEGWDNVDGTTPLEGEVSDRMGWGVPDLEKGMYGPGQFFNGKFTYNLKNLDVWSNDISQVALDQRAKEDIEWLKSVTDDGTVDGKVVVSDDPADYKLTNTSTGSANADGQEHNYDLAGIPDKEIDLEDAMKWRLEYYEKRAQAIRDKIANGDYNGSLVKTGEGTLVMTGNNTYRGGTTVEEGTLWGFNDSFGVTETEAKTTANGKVVVNGGSFGIMNSYNDEFTLKGEIKDESADHSVDIEVNAGGRYLISAGEDVSVGNITFAEGSYISVGSTDLDTLKAAYAGEIQTGTVTADGSITGTAIVNPDYAFFDTDVTFEDNKITGSLSYDEGSFDDYGSSSNAHKIGAAIGAAGEGVLFDQILGATKDQVTRTYDSLANDAFLNAQNAAIVNTITMTRAVKDQAQGIGGARVAEMADGTARIWATGIGTWGDVDYGNSSIDNDFYAGLVGAEVDVCPAAKVGVFFGAGTSEFDGGKDGKLESDDIHFGIYAQTNIQDVVGLNFGFTYTQQDREGHRGLTVGTSSAYNKINNDAQIAQIFVEGAYTGFNTASYSVEPYVGFSWMHVQSDDFSESVAGVEIETNNENQNVEVTTLGIRGAIPFTVGSVAMSVKGDVNWMHFFGDTSAEALLGLGGSGVAKIEGGELDNMFGVGLGIEAQLTKTTTFGLSYTGAYDGDVSSTGLFANVRFAF